jgi:Asp-tRNA(Asn)/Glu-tRNA(Gln) amidotransferase A subunit family amidase
MSVPCAPTPSTSERPALPVGLQLMGAPLDEERLFSVAAAVEASSPARRMTLPHPR